MSYISNNTQRQALWKVSDQTKRSSKQLPLNKHPFQIPQRFSPAKKGSGQSRLFNSSMERLKLSRLQLNKSRSPTPRSKERQSLVLQEHQMKKSQIINHPSTPKNQQKMPIVNLNSRDSCFSIGSEPAKNINDERVRNFLQQFEANRKIILALREEFTQFKASVLGQMNAQRKMVMQFISKIQQTCNNNTPSKKQAPREYDQMQRELEIKSSQQIQRVQNFQNLIHSVLKSQARIQPQMSTELLKQQLKFTQQFKLYDSMPITKIQAKNPQLKLEETKLYQKQVQFQQQSKQSQSQKRGSPHIQKCNQIVQTISMLNEINASPISPNKNAHQSSKSTQKLMIAEYKQKILAITKSNDNLIKEKTRQNLLRTEQQGKVKGNFKLQKFYNAIQKLKEEVNEIKSINQLKQSKKGKY